MAEPDLITIRTASGVPFTVAREHADTFKSFLDDPAWGDYALDAKQSGGYNPRNIAGTSTPSPHSFGRAIDLNWSDNPRGGAGKIPADTARALAQKYGLTWGGDWKNPDPMHFEVGSGSPAPMASRGIASFAGLGSPAASSPVAAALASPPSPGRSPMAMTDYSSPTDIGMSPEEVADKRRQAEQLSGMVSRYPGGGLLGALAQMYAGYRGGEEREAAKTGELARRGFGQRLMQEYNDAGRAPASSPLVSALAGGAPQGPQASGAPAGLPAGPGSMPANGMPPPQSPASSAPGAPVAPALAGPRPSFASTPGAMDTDRERRQEAILARAATMEGPVGDWARQQMTFVNQKKLAFGLEHEKAQISKQLDIEKANETQKQQINEMVALGILTEEQGQRALGKMGGGTQQGVAPAPAPVASGGPAAGGALPSIPGTAVDGARPAPLTPGGQMPPGTRPGPMTGQDDMTASMPPLSENAQRAQKMIEYGMMKGNRAMVQAGNDLLNADPTQEARKKQAEKMGVNDANLAERRRAGTNVVKTFDHFDTVTKQMREENPKAFDNAIGRVNSMPYVGDTLQTVRGAVMGLPGVNLTNNYAQGADYHNRMDHLIDGLTTAFMSSAAGSGLQMSDSRMAKFEQTMGAMRRASTPKEFDRIMGDARTIIRDVFSLNDGQQASAAHAEVPPAPSGGTATIAQPPAAAKAATGQKVIGFTDLPPHEKRSVVAEFMADKNPAKAEQFKQAFGQDGLTALLSIIQEQKAALAKPVTMPNPLSNFDASGRFTGAR